MNTTLEVKNLHYHYGQTPVLKGLNLQIRSGELVAIVGPSGSGKSTLLYLLGLLAAADSGTIKLLGTDIHHLSDEQLAQFRLFHLGFIFQQFHLLPKTSVLENILLPALYAKDSGRNVEESILRKRAIDLAEMVGLGERLNYHPNQLSGGQQQRVAICRALMNDPEIILADEPTGNLDSVSAEQIIDLLKELNRQQKKTILIITHDHDIAQKCDRIIRIKDGMVVADPGQPHEEVPSTTHEKKKPKFAD